MTQPDPAKPNMEQTMCKFDWNRPFTTRDGRPARKVCEGLSGDCPVGVGVMSSNGEESLHEYHQDGTIRFGYGSQQLNLVNIPTKRTVWLVLVPGRDEGRWFSDEQDSYHFAKGRGGKAIPVEIKE